LKTISTYFGQIIRIINGQEFENKWFILQVILLIHFSFEFQYTWVLGHKLYSVFVI